MGRKRTRRAPGWIVVSLAIVAAGVAASPAAARRCGARSSTSTSARRCTAGRFVPIPGFPGEKIDRRLLPDIRWMKQRFDIFITDGYSTDPVHAAEWRAPDRPRDRHRPQQGGGRHLARDRRPRPPGRAEAERAASRPGAGSDGTATPATDAATTSTSPGCTRRPSPGIRPASSTRAGARAPGDTAPAATATGDRHRSGGPTGGTSARPAASAATVGSPSGGRLARRSSPRSSRTTTRATQGRTVRPVLESGPRALSSCLARARHIRGTCPLPLKAASFRI